MPHVVVEEGLFAILHELISAAPSPSGQYLIFRGRIDVSNCPIPNPMRCMDTILRCFIYYAHQYRQLAVEEYYVNDQVSHHNYLRVVVSTATLAYYVTHSEHLNYLNPFEGTLDLTLLPFWVSKIIKKLVFSANFGLRFEYYEYDEIVEE